MDRADARLRSAARAPGRRLRRRAARRRPGAPARDARPRRARRGGVREPRLAPELDLQPDRLGAGRRARRAGREGGRGPAPGRVARARRGADRAARARDVRERPRARADARSGRAAVGAEPEPRAGAAGAGEGRGDRRTTAERARLMRVPTYPDRRYRSPPTASLEQDLRKAVDGEVRFSNGDRALYATGGSNYRQLPIGVVLPRTVDDVLETVRLCREYEAPVLSRGGGTSLAGQCCNVAVMIDF